MNASSRPIRHGLEYKLTSVHSSKRSMTVFSRLVTIKNPRLVPRFIVNRKIDFLNCMVMLQPDWGIENDATLISIAHSPVRTDVKNVVFLNHAPHMKGCASLYMLTRKHI
jgi:hypothetical protein